MSKYTIECADFMDHADEGRWRSYDLFAEGDTLEELLDSAVYMMTDQDGGEMGQVEADDDKAQAYIAEKFIEKHIATVRNEWAENMRGGADLLRDQRRDEDGDE